MQHVGASAWMPFGPEIALSERVVLPLFYPCVYACIGAHLINGHGVKIASKSGQ